MEKVIYVAGIGPGEEKYLTGQVREVLDRCDVIVGYSKYVELLRCYYPDKDYRTTGMKQEMDRCRMCFELAEEGRSVAMICSGDPGIYGMASPMLEMRAELQRKMTVSGAGDPEDLPEIVVIPGITAACSGASLLGAPLNHDFCAVSLSDLLTPWEVIEKRLRAAAAGDFVTVIYNPGSRGRADHLRRACGILRDAGVSPDRVCGYVENAGREGERVVTCTLAELAELPVNMFMTVFIGNSGSYINDGKLITKRGYDI